MSFDIMIVGIGGQGTILTSNILGKACVIEGIPVRGAETHGMAQRGGSVESQIRIDQEFGPLIPPGTADLLISFDLMETVRAAHWLKPDGHIYSLPWIEELGQDKESIHTVNDIPWINVDW